MADRRPDYYAQMGRGQLDIPGYDTRGNSGFLTLQPAEGTFSGDWKFHLSVDPNYVSRAWDVVVDELTNDSIMHTAKVAKPPTAASFNNPLNIQAGKMITVYTDNSVPPEHYQNLMSRIEQRLLDARVLPGPVSNADRMVPGSAYVSYRRETGPNGEYVASNSLKDMPRDQRFNPWNAPDPYRNFTMAPETTIVAGLNGASRPDARTLQTPPQAPSQAPSQAPPPDPLPGGAGPASEAGAGVKAAGLSEYFTGMARKIKGGLMPGAVIGTVAATVALYEGQSPAQAAQTGLAGAIPFAGAAIKAAQGDGTGAVRAAVTDTAGLGGAIAGAAGGAALGTAIMPGIGTAVGGIAGGIAGGLGAGFGADALLNVTGLFNNAAAPPPPDPRAAIAALRAFNDTARMAGMSPETQHLYELRNRSVDFNAQIRAYEQQGGPQAEAMHRDLKAVIDEYNNRQAATPRNAAPAPRAEPGLTLAGP